MMRALIVEDDPQIRNLLTQVLELDGYEVVEAANGVEGWERMTQIPADLVVTDLLMPRMDGLDLARRLRESYGDQLKIVIVSSLNGVDDGITSQNGANAFVSKPVNVNELRRVIGALMV